MQLFPVAKDEIFIRIDNLDDLFDSRTNHIMYRHINVKDILREMYKILMKREGSVHGKDV
jgi:hypothetical protein